MQSTSTRTSPSLVS
ncbi:hypothetical protein LINPERPRIM_LOCUS24060 [Linum perenne]